MWMRMISVIRHSKQVVRAASWPALACSGLLMVWSMVLIMGTPWALNTVTHEQHSDQQAESIHQVLTANDVVAYYQQELEKGPLESVNYLKLARLYQAMNQPDRAVSIYLQALQRDPGHSQANYLLAQLYHKTQQPQLAIKHAHRALNLAPEHADYYLLLARLYKDNDPMRASSLLQQALDITTTNEHIILDLAILFIEHQHYQRAIDLYKTTAHQHPQYIYLFKPIVQALRRAEAPAHLLCQVLDWAGTYLEVKDKVLLLELGYQYTEIGQFPKAMASYERAAEF